MYNYFSIFSQSVQIIYLFEPIIIYENVFFSDLDDF